MASYRDLPLDVEKYSLTPYLSAQDIASLSLVDTKRRELYDRKYWEKRFLEEEGKRLPSYGYKESPSLRYIKAKKYQKAKKQFDEDVKKMEQYFATYIQDDESEAFIETLHEPLIQVVKYGTPFQAKSLVKTIEEDLPGDGKAFYDDMYSIIGKYGRPDVVEKLWNMYMKEYPYVLRDIFKSIITEGRIDVLRFLNLTRDEIEDRMATLVVSDENLKKVQDYLSTLEK